MYQLSYAWPIYKALGGTFCVRKRKTVLKYRRYLKQMAKYSDDNRNTPDIIRLPLKDYSDLEGIILSQSNARIYNDPSRSRTVFVGHGNGDKKFGGSASTLETYQYLFISGPKYMERLRDVGLDIPEEKLVKTGNLRFDDYLNPKISRDSLLDIMGVPDERRMKKFVLYAPTWKWGNGTLRKYAKLFARELTDEFNLIIRPHHFDSHYIPYLKMWIKLNGISNVYFSNPNLLTTNDTMQDFLLSDVLISDTSSILYEYLITEKPIIVAETDFSGLHKMPDSMNIMTIADIYDGSRSILELVQSSLADEKKQLLYKQMLNECFYYNDGKSLSRALDFLSVLQESMK